MKNYSVQISNFEPFFPKLSVILAPFSGKIFRLIPPLILDPPLTRYVPGPYYRVSVRIFPCAVNCPNGGGVHYTYITCTMNAHYFFIFIIIGTIRAIALVPIEMVMINYKELCYVSPSHFKPQGHYGLWN